jgi:glycosyltransferase involved in cell wall biosynthesis
MILGMPVISSSVGGIKTLVKDGETGLLFNPYDKYDLAGILVNALSNYELMIQLGENARKVALKRHMPETILKDLTNIYNEIFHDNN